MLGQTLQWKPKLTLLQTHTLLTINTSLASSQVFVEGCPLRLLVNAAEVLDLTMKLLYEKEARKAVHMNICVSYSVGIRGVRHPPASMVGG